MKKLSTLSLISLLCVIVLVSCISKQVPPPSTPAKIAIVLGAGASKGFAHVGVLKVLESHKIPIHMIVGTSAGSFVGSLYAYGYDAYKLQTMSFSLKREDVFDLTLPDNGFIKGEKLEQYLNNALGNSPIEKLRIPFYAVATNIRTGEEVVFGLGSAAAAVRASCSIPGIFRPVKIGEETYVDGGVVSPLAVEAARRYGADVVIAVDVSSGVERGAPQGTIDTILRAVDIMYSRMSLIQRSKADIIIRPNVGHIGSADFTKRHEAILEGEKAAMEALPEINKIIQKLKQEGRLP